jgi:hypothetical protein
VGRPSWPEVKQMGNAQKRGKGMAKEIGGKV